MNFISSFSAFVNESFFNRKRQISQEEIQKHHLLMDRQKEEEFDYYLDGGKLSLTINRSPLKPQEATSGSDRGFSLTYFSLDGEGEIKIDFSSLDGEERIDVLKLSREECEDKEKLIFLTRELLDYISADENTHQLINSGALERVLSKTAYFRGQL